VTERSEVTGRLSTERSEVTGRLSTERSEVTGRLSTERSEVTGRLSTERSEVTGRVSAQWLALREAADAAARAVDLVEPVRRLLAGTRRPVIHDLGSGTGSMGRWLAPLLPGRQHWIMYDRDTDLLHHAATGLDHGASAETRVSDITRLTPDDLAGAHLITASALLDMLTAEEIERVVAACAAAGCPTLLTISVTGRVELTPPDPLDDELISAFNAHQRRRIGGRVLLGPDAIRVTVEAFTRRGIGVVTRSSPWRLGAGQDGLMLEWLAGWLSAAREQRPDLAGPVAAYAERRQAQAAAGRLRVVVDHSDLLAGAE
jgi:hypothetical protein